MVHEKVLEEYKKNSFDYYKRAEDYNEEAFFEQAEGAKAPIKKELVKVVRVKHGNNEYFYYHEELKSTNFLGNTIHLYRVVGKYDLPVFNKQIDTKTNKPYVTDIDHHDTYYELKWNKDWTSELKENVTETTDFMIITPSRKYGAFSLDEFEDNSFQDLITLGKFGTLEPARIEEVKKKVKAR